MAITHQTATRNALAALINDRVNTGATTSGGQVIFRTATSAEVATVTFSNPAFGAPTDGVITANAITDDTNATGGDVTNFIVTNRDGATEITGTVTGIGGGGDIELSSTSIGAGDTVSITALEYEASA